jgi:linoleoyl-CoA desaturase
MEQKIKFKKLNESQFYTTLKERVENYFTENNLSKNANFEMVLKTFVILGTMSFSYYMILWGNLSAWGMLPFALILGLGIALAGFNIGHDAVHGSYSNKKWVNKFFSYIFNTIGANSYIWSISHNIVHHTFTNVPDTDEDIQPSPLLRLSPTAPKWSIHKYQHIYGIPLYGLASLSWVFWKDYQRLFKEKIGNFRAKHPAAEIAELFIFKIIHYTIFIVIPLMVLEIPIWQFIIGFVAMHMVAGFTLGLVFQLAHVVEGPEFPQPDEKGNMQVSWAEHQLITTSDFGRSSGFLNWMLGGLNMQVEHHLFPHICHVHYPNLSKIVEQTAKEYGVPYLENKTMFQALASHYRMLKKLGN